MQKKHGREPSCLLRQFTRTGGTGTALHVNGAHPHHQARKDWAAFENDAVSEAKLLFSG